MRIFASNPDRIKADLCRNWLIDREIGTQELDDAYIAPLRQLASVQVPDAAFSGGVLNSDGSFAAGHIRMLDRKPERDIWALNRGCDRGYSLKEASVVEIDDSVIYGGIIHNHFGHFILESLTRLWYVFEHNEDLRPIVFNSYGKECSFVQDFFEILGIAERVVVVDTAGPVVRFGHITIPDQSSYCFSGYLRENCVVYDRLRDLVPAGKFKKVYLSRAKMKRKLTVGEQYFEDWFRERGYAVFSTETLSIREQLSILAGAEEIACINGTLSLLLSFCRPGVRLVSLSRNGFFVQSQFLVNQMREIDTTFIDVGCSYLPYRNGSGCWMVGPTSYWGQFVDNCGYGVIPKDGLEQHCRQYAYDYVREWCRSHTEKGAFKALYGSTSMFDLLRVMNKGLWDRNLDRSAFEGIMEAADSRHFASLFGGDVSKTELAGELASMRDKLERAEHQLAESEKKLAALKTTLSWRVTRPLRRMKRLAASKGGKS